MWASPWECAEGPPLHRALVCVWNTRSCGQPPSLGHVELTEAGPCPRGPPQAQMQAAPLPVRPFCTALLPVQNGLLIQPHPGHLRRCLIPASAHGHRKGSPGASLIRFQGGKTHATAMPSMRRGCSQHTALTQGRTSRERLSAPPFPLILSHGGRRWGGRWSSRAELEAATLVCVRSRQQELLAGGRVIICLASHPWRL